MSRPRTLLYLAGCMLGLTVDGLFLWPRMVPYYYPLPVSSDSPASSSFPSSVHSSPQYMYDWNQYNQNNPHSNVLYPGSSDHSSMVPPLPTGGHSPLSGLTRWFQKPWLSWKLAKFGLRHPSHSSPCSSLGQQPSSGLMPSLSQSVSSLFPSLSSSSLSSSMSAPCTTKTTICCNGAIASPSRPNFIQTHVTYNPPSQSSAYDRHSSQIHYPSNYVSYSSGSSPTLNPQPSEQSYEFVSS